MNKSEQFLKLTAKLPSFCHNFLYSGLSETSIDTKIDYANDLIYFFSYAIDNYPYFCDKELNELSIDDIKKIQATDINQYLMQMKDFNHLKDRTRARRKSSLSSLFKYLVKTEYLLEYNPMDGSNSVKIKKEDYVKYLTIEEQEILLNVIYSGSGLTDRQLKYHDSYRERDLAIVFLFLDTGLRISELQSIDIKDVDFDERCIYVVRKGGKAEKVYFSDESREYISDYLNTKELSYGYSIKDPLFTTKTSERLSIRAIQHMVKKYLTAALPHKASEIGVHKLRSSFAMEYYKTNKDLLALQKRMGHKSIAATNIYAKASDEVAKQTRNWRIG